jgi:hypothetical protein
MNEPGLAYRGATNWDETWQFFLDGKCLFISSQVDSDFSMMEADFGVLPMPKWDAAQPGYIGSMDHNGKVLGVPVTNRGQDLLNTGIILDALGRAFLEIDDMRLEEFEIIRYRNDADGEMLMEYIRGTSTTDLAVFLTNAEPHFGAPTAMITSLAYYSDPDTPSLFETIREPIEYLLGDFFGYNE